MFLRIKSILIWGGLYIWINFVLIGMALLLVLFGLDKFADILFDFFHSPYFFWGISLFLFVFPPNFSSYLSPNQLLYFMFVGWLPFFAYLPIVTKNIIYLCLFMLSSSAAIVRFTKWDISEKVFTLILIGLAFIFLVLGNIVFAD
ncbi:MAG: hypothetical protein KHX55_05390 [Proteobacteria bacterium]|nr:hypothetical protein [Pseudomonadota bacterium]